MVVTQMWPSCPAWVKTIMLMTYFDSNRFWNLAISPLLPRVLGGQQQSPQQRCPQTLAHTRWQYVAFRAHLFSLSNCLLQMPFERDSQLPCVSKLQATLLFFAKHNHQNHFCVLLSRSRYIQHGDNFSCWVLSLGAVQTCVFFPGSSLQQRIRCLFTEHMLCTLFCDGSQAAEMIWAQLPLWSSF